jgi:hypothetical protein
MATIEPLSPFVNLKEWGGSRPFRMIDNYVYLHHLKEFVIIPTYPESVTDTTIVQFAQNTPLVRSAPIFSYSFSGPRGVGFTFKLHREMMKEINYKRSNAKVTLTDDYIDILVKYLQTAAYPKYSSTEKMVDPPLVTVRLGDEIYIKGVVSGNVQTMYSGPILVDENGNEKYAVVEISFTVHEVDPYDARLVAMSGSFRGLDTSLERNLWKEKGSLSRGLISGSGGTSVMSVR